MPAETSSSSFLERIQKLSPKRLALLAAELERRLATRQEAAPEPVAVIGIGCRMPGGAETGEEFWKLLSNGRDAIEGIPAARWDADAFYDPRPDTPHKAITKCGGFVRQIDQFDPAFFGISPREAAGMDPQQRMLLEVSWEALENAGERAETLEESATGVFIGISSSDYEQLVLQEGEMLDAYSGSGLAGSVAAGRLSHFLGLRGPNLAVDTACSASGVAIHLACQSLRGGECNRALAGGVNLVLRPASVVILSQAHMLAGDGRCKTFSRLADGFGRAEGCGILVLKRLSDAQADGDRILGLIRGTAINHDGRSSGLTAPNGPAQEEVVKAALAQARLSPHDIDYIEAHGTGTVLGDAIELGALGNVFAKERDPGRPLLLGSVKTNVGHLEPAAGVAGVIKVLLALNHDCLPPHLHLSPGNENEALQGLPFEIPLRAQPWRRSSRPRIAGISSFGFSGTNCHLIVEEAPLPEPAGGGPEFGADIVTISAKTPEALAALCGRYAQYLREHPETRLSDFAYTANACRSQFQHRVAVVANSAAGAAEQLEQAIQGDLEQSPFYRFVSSYQPPSIAFLFTGQGSQYSGMGRAFFESNAAFRSAIERCDRALEGKQEHRLSAVLFGAAEVPRELIDDTSWTQPALFALEYALAMMWQSWGIRPSVVLGHSLGEYVAACVAGVFSLEEALRLAYERGRLMGGLPRNGSMLAVRASEAVMSEAVGPLPLGVSVAALNGPESIVLSGRTEEISDLSRRLVEKGVKAQPLTVSHAFHSPLMEPMLEEFEQQAAEFTYRSPEIAFVSNVTGRPLGAAEPINALYWRRHVRGTVRFSEGMGALLAQKPGILFEAGPNPVLLGMAKLANPDLSLPCVPAMRRGKEEWQSVFEALQQLYLAGAPIVWDAVYEDRERQKLVLPNYPFQRQCYWVKTVANADPAKTLRANPEASAASAPEDQFEPRLYEVEWSLTTPQETAAQNTGAILGAHSVLLAGEAPLSEQIGKALSGQQAAVHWLPGSQGSLSLGGETFEDLCRDRELVRAALRAAQPQSVVLLLPDRSNAEDIPAAAMRNATAVLALLQEVIDCASARPSVWLVTQGAWAYDARQRLDLPASVAGAIAKVARLEHAGLSIHHVDLPSEPSAGDLERLAVLLRQGTTEHTLAIRRGGIAAPRLTGLDTPAQRTPLRIRPQGAYLVTGAFGGLGLRTAQWLVERGAKELFLTGRREPSPETRDQIEKLQASGARIHNVAADVSKRQDVERLFALMDGAGSELRGIVHAAGTVDDGVLIQQTPERFAHVFAPKVQGGWLLHEFSLRYPLDFFVMFASAAALLGLGGQSNYAAANAFLDSLAELRQQQGLPATAIAWGAWSEIGMATRVKAAQRASGIGIGLISPTQGIGMLELAVESGSPAPAVLAIDWRRFFASRTAHHDWPLLAGLAEGLQEPEKTAATTLALLVERAPAERRSRSHQGLSQHAHRLRFEASVQFCSAWQSAARRAWLRFAHGSGAQERIAAFGRGGSSGDVFIRISNLDSRCNLP